MEKKRIFLSVIANDFKAIIIEHFPSTMFTKKKSTFHTIESIVNVNKKIAWHTLSLSKWLEHYNKKIINN